jgi:hypothetical protein
LDRTALENRLSDTRWLLQLIANAEMQVDNDQL